MKREYSAKKNFIYNVMYQILVLIIPLITAPYLSRIVGADGVGIYSYSYSIVYYFMIFCLLGVNNYGNRTIAKTKKNREEMSKNFWGIYFFQLFLGIILLLGFYTYIFLFVKQYKKIFIIQSLFIVSSMLDINWLFFGLEEFKKTILRNSILKVLSLLLIFQFVKNRDDLWKYTLIMAGTTLMSQLVLWGFLPKYVSKVKLSLSEVIVHIKSNFLLFIPVIAVSLYKMMDKIMLGNMTSISEVGVYENAEKITSVPLTIITALGTVMLPRISKILSEGKEHEAKIYILKSINFVVFLSSAMCCGLIVIGNDFAPLFFGKEFQKTGQLIMILSITLPFIAFANVIRTQYLIPKEEDLIYIKSVFLGAVVNLFINIIMIPKFLSVGAAIGTVLAEMTVMIFQTVSIRRELDIKKSFFEIIPFIIKSTIMFVLIYPLNFLNLNGWLRIFLQVGFGCLVYALLNIKYLMSIINIDIIMKKFKEMKVKKK